MADQRKRFIFAMIFLLLFLCGCALHTSHEGQAQTPMENVKGKNYKDVEEIFRTRGFTNVQTERVEDLIFGWLATDGEVKEVSVAGEVDYAKGKWVPAETKVVIRYHTFPTKNEEADKTQEESAPLQSTTQTEATAEERTKTESSQTSAQTPNRAVSYSTNDRKTVKEGNSGIFAYKSKGGTYDIYYIIDFDDGFVYRFSEGNNDILCDRVKMGFGDLNSCLIITYHDGENSWSYGLHFKWKNQPDHLVVQEESGYSFDYYPTNLQEALSLREKKTFLDF